MTTAIVFVCDCAYIVPTIGAALSARTHTKDNSVPVYVFVADPEPKLLSDLRRVLHPRGLTIEGPTMSGLKAIDRRTFNPTHVPTTTLARLWLDEFLDPAIDRFLYLDGDVDITGELDELISLPIPMGGFLATPDLPLLIDGEFGSTAKATRAYLNRLGIHRSDDYFNCGVLLVDRSGWHSISKAARDFFFQNPTSCRYHDQSALNAVAGAARSELSLVWNYQADYMAVVDPRQWGYAPRIWHFTGFPKAWHGSVFPWTEEFGRSFQIGAEALGEFAPSATHGSESAVTGARLARDRLRLRLKWVYPWRRHRRAARIRAALASISP